MESWSAGSWALEVEPQLRIAAIATTRVACRRVTLGIIAPSRAGREADAPHERLESRLIPDGIEGGLDSEEDHVAGVLGERALQIGERLLPVSQPEIDHRDPHLVPWV